MRNTTVILGIAGKKVRLLSLSVRCAPTSPRPTVIAAIATKYKVRPTGSMLSVQVNDGSIGLERGLQNIILSQGGIMFVNEITSWNAKGVISISNIPLRNLCIV